MDQQAVMSVGDALGKAFGQHQQSQSSAQAPAEAVNVAAQAPITPQRTDASAPSVTGQQRRTVPLAALQSEKHQRQQLQVANAKYEADIAELRAQIAAQPNKPALSADDQWLAEQLDFGDDATAKTIKELRTELADLKKSHGEFSKEYRAQQQVVVEQHQDEQLSGLVEQVLEELPGLDPNYVETMTVALLSAEPANSTRQLVEILAPLAQTWKRYHGPNTAPTAPAANRSGPRPTAPPQIGAPTTPTTGASNKLDFGQIGKYIAQRAGGA